MGCSILRDLNKLNSIRNESNKNDLVLKGGGGEGMKTVSGALKACLQKIVDYSPLHWLRVKNTVQS